jgi:hypothetical protein
VNRALSLLVTRAPACLAAGSTLAYFALSEGIRAHVLMLWRAAHLFVGHST